MRGASVGKLNLKVAAGHPFYGRKQASAVSLCNSAPALRSEVLRGEERRKLSLLPCSSFWM